MFLCTWVKPRGKCESFIPLACQTTGQGTCQYISDIAPICTRDGYIYIYVCVCMYVCMYVCICIHIHMCVYIYVYVYVYVYAYIYIHMCTRDGWRVRMARVHADSSHEMADIQTMVGTQTHTSMIYYTLPADS